MEADTDQAGKRLAAALRGIAGGVAVAVSGGIDSLTLAAFAQAECPDVEMFHAVSPAVPGDATARVERLAEQRGWRLRVVEAGEFNDANYIANPTNRCFFCKTNLYGAIARHTSSQMVSGANTDDLGEYRPGLDAARGHEVRHPYLEAGIDKRTVRGLARRIGLGALSELPAAPCLSSRVETGIAIRPEVLRAIHAVERDLAQDFPARHRALPGACLGCRDRTRSRHPRRDRRGSPRRGRPRCGASVRRALALRYIGLRRLP